MKSCRPVVVLLVSLFLAGKVDAQTPDVQEMVRELLLSLRIRGQTPDTQGQPALSYEESLRTLKNKDSEANRRLDAVASLRQLAAAARGAVPVLLAVLKDDPIEDVRAEAARALGRIGPAKDVVPALRRAQSDDAYVGVAAAEALGLVDPACEAEAVAYLIKAVAASRRHPDMLPPGVVRGALANLGVRARSAAPALLPWLRDPDPIQRLSTLDALRQIGADQEVFVAPLMGVLRDEMPLDRLALLAECARTALLPLVRGRLGENSVTAEQLGEQLRTVALIRRESRLRALDVLGNIGPAARRALPLVQELTRDPVLGKTATRALERIQKPR
jgi:HEAT repeat protein